MEIDMRENLRMVQGKNKNFKFYIEIKIF
jgi:hypothetical protein